LKSKINVAKFKLIQYLSQIYGITGGGRGELPPPPLEEALKCYFSVFIAIFRFVLFSLLPPLEFFLLTPLFISFLRYQISTNSGNAGVKFRM